MSAHKAKRQPKALAADTASPNGALQERAQDLINAIHALWIITGQADDPELDRGMLTGALRMIVTRLDDLSVKIATLAEAHS